MTKKEDIGFEGKQDVYGMDPDKLVLITDPSDPLYDPRVDWPVDEALAKNIAKFGVLEPIKVRRNGQNADGTAKLEVVFGRQRVKAARMANEILRSEGSATITVPCMIERGNDAKMFGILLTENELRKGDDAITRAEKAQRYLDMGKTHADVALVMGLSVSGVGFLLKVLDLDVKVQEAIKEGKLPFTTAVNELGKLGRKEQKKALDELLEAGVSLKGEKGVDAVRRKVKGEKEKTDDGEEGEGVERGPVSKMRLRRHAEEALEYAKKAKKSVEPEYAAGFMDGLRWMLRMKARNPSMQKILTGEEEG